MSTAVVLVGNVVSGLVLLYFASRPATGSRETSYANKPATKIIGLDEVASHSQLVDPGAFVVRTFRQSGNLHQEDRSFSDASSALRAALSTFRRSNIEFVVIDASSPTEFTFRRPWHDHRGRSEGKKVGWVEILRID